MTYEFRVVTVVLISLPTSPFSFFSDHLWVSLRQELVVMGAPGSFYWAGTVKVLNLTDNTYFKLNDEAIMNRRYTYLGE